tara:strand:- start:99 stop:323 length:225 start_codon:yes stop_codon:yes gene_type:complete
MEPKFSIGQVVVVVKTVTFLFDHTVVRAGEVGTVMEYDYFIVAPDTPFMIDYIVKVGDRTLFFYEDELAPYPEI